MPGYIYVSSAVGSQPPPPSRSGFAWLAGVCGLVGHSGLAVGCRRLWPFACPQWTVDALQCLRSLAPTPPYQQSFKSSDISEYLTFVDIVILDGITNPVGQKYGHVYIKEWVSTGGADGNSFGISGPSMGLLGRGGVGK